MSEVVFVGTSDAFGAGGRRQSAYLFRSAAGCVLLDCGTTTGTGLADLGIERGEVDAILVSHFHADHFGGIPLLLLAALYEDRRREPLTIAGPPGIEARVRNASAALGHPMENQEWTFPVRFVELRVDHPTPAGPVEVRAFATHHSPDSEPHGFVVRGGSERLAYSGDTGWFSALPRQVAGSNLFLCECTLVENTFEYHLSLDELSARRSEFDCGRLVLTHLGSAMRRRTSYEGFEVADDDLLIKL